MRRVIFRADAGGEIGYGHFVRSLALAGMIRDYFEIRFASFSPGGLNEFLCNSISDIGRPLNISAGNLSEYDRRFVAEISSEDIVVLDNYYFSDEYRKEIAARAAGTVEIADFPGEHSSAAILISSTSLEREKFGLQKKALYLGGSKFALLRSPFYSPVSKREKGKLRKLLIAIGGTDPYGLAQGIVENIKEITPGVEIKVIGKIEIRKEWNGTVSSYRNLDALEVRYLMDEADLGIFPASTLCLEAFSRGLPVAAGWFADNQMETYKDYLSKKYIFPLGNLLADRPQIKEILGRLLVGEEDQFQIFSPAINFRSGREEIIEAFLKLDSRLI